MLRRNDYEFEEGEEVEENKELENEDEENDDDNEEEGSSEEEEDEEDEEEDDVKLVRTERGKKEISEEIAPVAPARSRVGGKEPRKEYKDMDKYRAKRLVDNFIVEFPEVEPKNEKWAYILDNELQPNSLINSGRKASCQMRDTDGAIHMIAYFCSILNTDPAYIDP